MQYRKKDYLIKLRTILIHMDLIFQRPKHKFMYRVFDTSPLHGDTFLFRPPHQTPSARYPSAVGKKLC